jgi:energy-coupling factor transporter ATP-binding protein EcfA2
MLRVVVPDGVLAMCVLLLMHCVLLHGLLLLQVYPATLFTSAPLQLVKEALKAASAAAAAETATVTSNGSSGGGSSSSSNLDTIMQQRAQVPPEAAADSASRHSSAGSSSSVLRLSPLAAVPAASTSAVDAAASDQLQLLACSCLSVSTPSGLPIVKDLFLSLVAAAAGAGPPNSSSSSGGVTSLLIRGPSGCGKSTLLKCLAGLWPADAGRFFIPAESAASSAVGSAAAAVARSVELGCSSAAAAGGGVLFLPQRMLAAPGHTLREQLAYPAAASACACSCRGAACSSSSSSSSVQHSRRRLFRKGRASSTSTCISSASAGSAAAEPGSYHAVCIPTGGTAASSKQRRVQPLRLQLACWWDDWLSCGIKRGVRQQQQQRQCTVSGSRQEQQQQQVQEHVKQHNNAGCVDGTVDVSRQVGNNAQHCMTCQQLLAALQLAGLSYLLAALPAGLDAAAEDWGAVLSPGEMQRLGFARVLLHKPLLAVLDEATSSLPGEVAVQLYQQLQQAGVSYVSVGHSSSLLQVHQQVLSIVADGAGGWQLQYVQDSG